MEMQSRHDNVMAWDKGLAKLDHSSDHEPTAHSLKGRLIPSRASITLCEKSVVGIGSMGTIYHSVVQLIAQMVDQILGLHEQEKTYSVFG